MQFTIYTEVLRGLYVVVHNGWRARNCVIKFYIVRFVVWGNVR